MKINTNRFLSNQFLLHKIITRNFCKFGMEKNDKSCLSDNRSVIGCKLKILYTKQVRYLFINRLKLRSGFEYK